jgi:hypothetical protein
MIVPNTPDLQTLLSGVPNPFLQDRVDTPWQPGFQDVESINRTAFTQCLQSIEQVRQGNQSRGLVVHGEPGSGKTHLLQRLRLCTQKDPRTWFVYLPPFTGPGRFWRHLLEHFFYDLCQRSKIPETASSPSQRIVTDAEGPGQGPMTQIEEALTRHLVGRPLASTSELARWWAEICRQDEPGQRLFLRLERTFGKLTVQLRLDPEVMRVLRHYLAWNERTEAYAFLLGRDLTEEGLLRLGAGRSLDDEERARQAVLTFCRLAGSSFAIILAFDQLEGMQLTPDDNEGLHIFGNNAVHLMSECPNLLLLSAVQTYFLPVLEKAMHIAYYQRITQDESILTLLKRDSAILLVEQRLLAQPEIREIRRTCTGLDALWPLRRNEIEALVQAGGIPARLLLRQAKQLFDNRRDVKPPVPSPKKRTERINVKLGRYWVELFEQEMQLPLTRVDEGVYEDGLLKLLQAKSLPGRRVERGAGRDVHAILEGHGKRTAVSISNSENMTSLARQLGRLQELLKAGRFARVILVRDSRLPVSATAQQTQRRLRQLSESGNAVIRPGAEVYAALNVLRKLWAKAAENDLIIGDDAIEPGELRRWLAEKTPRPLQELIDSLAEGESVGNHGLQERLLEKLMGKWILPVSEVAAQLGTDEQSLMRQIENQPEVAGLCIGPPAVVFLLPEAASRS